MQRPINRDGLRIFYNAIGEAVWQIQYLEHALVNFIVIKRYKRKPTTEEQAIERLEKERKGTLGSIYKRAKEEDIIPGELEARFEKLLSERNWLIHNSRTDNSEDLYNDDKTEAIIGRIHSITEESLELMGEILKKLELFIKKEGFNIREVYEKADLYIRNLEGS